MTGAAQKIRATPEEQYAHLLNLHAELKTAFEQSVRVLAQHDADTAKALAELADAVGEVVTLAREARPLLESKWMTAMRARLAAGRGTPA